MTGTQGRMRYLRYWRYTRSGRPVCLTLRFRDGKIIPEDARKWARSVAREWGDINWEKAVKVKGLPGPAWWFSCSGHGGYILVAPAAEVPEIFERFKWEGLSEEYGNLSVYVFEEDCDWAVFVLAFPEVAMWEIENLRVWPSDLPRDAGIGCAVGRLLERAKESVRRWKPPEVAAALGL